MTLWAFFYEFIKYSWWAGSIFINLQNLVCFFGIYLKVHYICALIKKQKNVFIITSKERDF